MTSVKRDPDAKDIAINCVKNYEVNTSAYLQEVVKQALASFYSAVLNAEFLAHLGYEKSSSASKESLNRRNGFIKKKVRSSFGALEVQVPRDRDGSFMPIAIRKHSRAVTSSESKVLTMFARGMTDEDVALTIQKMYCFDLPEEKVQIIQNRILTEVHESATRPLKPVYAFVLLAKIDFKVKPLSPKLGEDMSLYLIQGVDQEGQAELLDMFLSPPAQKSNTMTLLENLKNRGVEDIVVLLSEGISTKEKEAQSVFPLVTLY